MSIPAQARRRREARMARNQADIQRRKVIGTGRPRAWYYLEVLASRALAS